MAPTRLWSPETVAALALDGDELHTALVGRDGTLHFTQSAPDVPQSPALLLQLVAESADDLLRARPDVLGHRQANTPWQISRIACRLCNRRSYRLSGS